MTSEGWREEADGCADFHREPRQARLAARAWRARERAAHPKPPSDKVVHPRVLVDVPPAPKKGRVGK